MTRNIIILLIPVVLLSSNSAFCQKILDNSSRSFFEIVSDTEKLLSDTSKSQIPGKESALIREDLYYRWEWFWSSRIDKNGEFDEYGKQLKKVIAEESIRPLNKSASNSSWTALGPTSAPPATCSKVTRVTGLMQVTSIWANSSILYVGLNGGGLWKRDGSSWENLTDNVACLSVFDIEVDNSGKIYLATGFDGQGGSLKENDLYGMGVIYSTDGGSNWVTDRMTSDPDEDFQIEKILIHPSYQSTVYALSRSTVYKSTNGGYTWTDTQAPTLESKDYYTNMVFKEGDPDTIYICSAGRLNTDTENSITGCIYKTTNGGTSWSNTNLANNLAYSSCHPHWIDIATTPDDPSAIFVVYQDTASLYTTLERSTDGGSNWTTLVSRDDIVSAAYMRHTLAISPDDKDDIFLGSVNQYKYDKVNSEFDRIGSSLHPDLRDFYFVNSGGTLTIYQGNDAGIYSSTDNGITWTNLSNGIQGSLFYDIAISEEDTEKYIGGVGDCGTHYFNGTSWANMCIEISDGGTCLINEHNTANMYAMANYLYYYTKDSGSTWSYTGQKTRGYNKPIIQHPTSNKIYLATSNDLWWHRVRVSSDNGDNWTDYSDRWANDRIMAMAISESDPDYFYLTKVLYTYTNGWNQTTTIVRSTDDGSNWTDITSGLGTITSEAKMQHIEIHPEDPDIVWVSFGGLSSGKKIYMTENGGTSWTNISYNLPNLPHSKIEYNNAHSVLYVSNDIGVYYLKDGETSWTRMGDFPYAVTTGLELNRETGILYAATWGRGLWQTDIKGQCYDGTSLTISSPTLWSSDRELCQDLVISSGNLTIRCDVIMPFDATITVEDGATLIVSGTVYNANIIVEDGGVLEVKAGGTIKPNDGDMVDVEAGGQFDFDYGEVQPIAQ